MSHVHTQLEIRVFSLSDVFTQFTVFYGGRAMTATTRDFYQNLNSFDYFFLVDFSEISKYADKGFPMFWFGYFIVKPKMKPFNRQLVLEKEIEEKSYKVPPQFNFIYAYSFIP